VNRPATLPDEERPVLLDGGIVTPFNPEAMRTSLGFRGGALALRLATAAFTP
jgi:hypothetical protein